MTHTDAGALLKLAEIIHKARWPADRQMAVTPFADEDSNGREYCFRIARAVQAASQGSAGGEAGSWRLVPIEPTQEMIAAAEDAREAYQPYSFKEVFIEMINAAPALSPPVKTGGEVETPIAPATGWLAPALDKADDRAAEMPRWMVDPIASRPVDAVAREEIDGILSIMQGRQQIGSDLHVIRADAIAAILALPKLTAAGNIEAIAAFVDQFCPGQKLGEAVRKNFGSVAQAAIPFLCPCCGARGTTDGKASTVSSASRGTEA